MDAVMANLMVGEGLPTNFLGVQTLLLGLACYLYGSIPFAYLFTYIFKKEKLTDKGTGNIGVANTFGVAGIKAGFLTVVGEATKVMLPIALSRYYYEGALVISLIFISLSILGTAYSVFLKGKGGQGTTVLLWALLLLSPYSFLLYTGVFLLLFIAIKRRYYATILGYALLPVEIFAIEQNIHFVIFGALAALYYCLRYKPQRSDYTFYSRNMRLLRYIEGKFRNKKRLIVDIKQAGDSSLAGQKARSLLYLEKLGAQIPVTYVCTFNAYDEYILGNHDVINSLREELKKVIDIGKEYSVRSSANLEDHRDHSFAGQFDTYLNIQSIDNILESIISIWASVSEGRVKSYLERIDIPSQDLKMSVIVQEMVDAEFSGVIFTKNPLTGLDEVIVEAITGSGLSLLQDGNTPQRWIYKWGECIEKPQEENLDPTVISQVVVQAKKIDKEYGSPVDLEWVYDGSHIYWLQLREITTIKGINIYSNRISKGFMPGIIKPLIWSVNIPVVNTSWKKLFVELIGGEAQGIDIHSLAKSFYYRAYFNMGVIGDIFQLVGMPRELIELLLGYEVTGDEKPKFRPGLRAIKYAPRMFIFALRKVIFSRKIEKLLGTRKAEYDEFLCSDLDTMTESETIQAIDRLFSLNADTSYYVIVSQLLMGFYNMVFNRLLARKGISPDGVSFLPVLEELHDIDPRPHLEKLNYIYANLPEELKRDVNELSYHAFSELNGLEDFRLHINNFLSRFGHLSDSGNDFSLPQWKENPELIINTVINYRQTSQQERHTDKQGDNYPVIPKGLFTKLFYANAVKYRVYREKVNFLYVYGYGLFRPYFLHMADLFKNKGYLCDAGDIFYLTFPEIKDILALNMIPEEYKASIEKRKQEIVKWKDIDLPETIIGDETPPPVETKKTYRILKGVAASKGYCEGRTKTVRGVYDFAAIDIGDILVIPHSDISWTPIFSKAKAVISESGGILSHCAIVAREYKIPAIVSVPHALQIREDTLVVVDGFKGEIVIIEEDS